MTSSARLRVEAAGPHVSFQDGGRPGMARYGVPASGPMDPFGHHVANVAVGNVADAVAIEVSLGGLTLRCETGPVTVAVAGGGFLVNGVSRGWPVLVLEVGDTLDIAPGNWGSWAYVAFAGDIDAPQWLGSSATHALSGLGGGALVAGDAVDVAVARSDRLHEVTLVPPPYAQPSGVARVVIGPQADHFDDAAVPKLLGSVFQLTAAFDRMGVRLSGPPLQLGGGLTVPSEPVVAGALQVAGDGVATLLLADHQTTGGYPKIATVISTDIAQLVQHRPGAAVRFEAVTPAAAIAAVRKRRSDWASALQDIRDREPSLDARLRHHNLITWGDEGSV